MGVKSSKPPRLHDACALDEAAAWLTYWTDEEWNIRAVLARFLEWIPRGGTGQRRPVPETVKVVVPAGHVLVDPFTNESHVLSAPLTLLVAEPGLEAFLEALQEHGNAVPPTLHAQVGLRRWRTNALLCPADLRFTAAQVEALLEPWDALLRDAKLGLINVEKLMAEKQPSPKHESAAESLPAVPEPVPRLRAQELRILQELRTMGHDPMRLPRGEPGKPSVKAAVRQAIGSAGMWSGSTVFEKAWKRLRAAGEIADSE